MSTRQRNKRLGRSIALGGLAELVLVAGPVLAFAIYELVKIRREIKPAKVDDRNDRQA